MTEDRFDSVWDALENSPAEAANMKARSGLMIAIQETVAGWKLTQAEAAKRLGVTQPRMNDLLRGRIDKFSLDALMILATGAGLSGAWKKQRLEFSLAGLAAAPGSDGACSKTYRRCRRTLRQANRFRIRQRRFPEQRLLS